MDIHLYVRIRGRVHGPFDTDKLNTMIHRGQLSRIHQVSEDGNTWKKAAEYPELFTQAAQAPRTAEEGELAQEQVTERWYYEDNQQPVGPIAKNQLVSMLSTGTIEMTRRVWREGMPDWAPANSLTELTNYQTSQSAATYSEPQGTQQPHSGEPVHEMASDSPIPPATMNYYQSTRPWVLFLSIMTFVYAGLSASGGIYLMIVGGRFANASIWIANGLMGMITGGVIATAGIFLIGYVNGLSRLRITRSIITLNQALASLNRFWMFVSIVTIVLTVYFLFLMIYVVAVIGTLPLPEPI